MENIKNIDIKDNCKLNDKMNDAKYCKPEHGSVHKTRIIVKNELGEILFEGENKVIIPGSTFTAMKHFNMDAPVKLPSYNDVLGLQNSIADDFTEGGVRREEIVCLFAIGTDGCGDLNHQVYGVNYIRWIKPEALIPFRYIDKQAIPPKDDLTAVQRRKYYGRKVEELTGNVAYYFKKFEREPMFVQQFKDGTVFDENVLTNPKGDYNVDDPNNIELLEPAETYIELELRVSKEDTREWFLNSPGGLNSSRVNTFSLLTAYPTTVNETFTDPVSGATVNEDVIYYQNIRPLTKYNIPNEALIQETKALAITYQIFY